ncbi:MAG: pyridoxal 5'-phosphate synthase glutaminase subunit PdxT [Firmicutes bacterium]|nr:pyridoxal 5'-phosphate synthase glutaminase subunit PdxT [Bacillota bacterium]
MRIAVLALQGAFIEHEQALARLGVEMLEIRRLQDMKASFDGLIIPGGESTVQGKLLRELGLHQPLRQHIAAGLPVFGTCAGLLLLAGRIENDTRVHLATMDITAVRNAYGRQLGSFYTEADFRGIGKIPMTFIRAPYIAAVGAAVQTLAEVNGRIVAARQGMQLVTAFHPELNDDLSVHRYFVEMIAGAAV